MDLTATTGGLGKLIYDSAFRLIVSARVKMLFEEPELGLRISRVVAVPTDGTGAMSTDGEFLFYDPAWVLGLPVAEVLRLMMGQAATLPKWVAPA